ncbi:hypothetical protein ACIHCQ_24295 [Streptomyces sp. NPDC052236]|uniref:hypothetical protein n=1 Tax=Streptomyces sp. NPDC052236 TaxID=3365686 RepID=UPI0037D6E0A8
MHPLGPGDPRSIGAYRLLGRLGAGAVKVVHPHFALDKEFRARFRREVPMEGPP